MPKSIKIYIFILVLIFIGVIVIDANRPKPVNWAPTYSVKDKIPYGLYVLDNEINNLFKGQKIEKFGVTPYEFLDPKYTYTDSTYNTKGTILYINENCDIDNESAHELLYFASHGNSIFISASDFSRAIRDTLHFDYGYANNYSDTLQFSLNNKEKYKYLKGVNDVYFKEYDSTKVEILGYQKNSNNDSVPNFIRIPHVNGYFYLHTQPAAFTNYYLLHKENYKYAEKTLSYIEDEKIFWYLEGNRNNVGSPMRYWLSQPALKWAWYISLISIFIFMIFNAKRRQRVIPIKEPLRNTTVDFTKTIGNLYYQEGNHQDIIDKKIKFFLEKIRNEYLVDTFDLNESFINRLHQKTGKSKAEIENLVRLIKKYRNQEQSTEKDLLEFNNTIEKLGI